VRLLLDTHVALWAITDDTRLPEVTRGLIAAPANTITLSVASLWEFTIKHALARAVLTICRFLVPMRFNTSAARVTRF
jgi:PIN domain nuclease of toxin-antitoxin system